MAQLKPLRGKIIIRPLGEEGVERLRSIYVPPQWRDPKPMRGEVLAVGEGVREVEVGDWVIYHPWADSANFKWEGELLAVVDESVVVGKLLVPVEE
jgi:co-chaperonin GroES (HSP10)